MAKLYLWSFTEKHEWQVCVLSECIDRVSRLLWYVWSFLNPPDNSMGWREKRLSVFFQKSFLILLNLLEQRWKNTNHKLLGVPHQLSNSIDVLRQPGIMKPKMVLLLWGTKVSSIGESIKVNLDHMCTLHHIRALASLSCKTASQYWHITIVINENCYQLNHTCCKIVQDLSHKTAFFSKTLKINPKLMFNGKHVED